MSLVRTLQDVRVPSTGSQAWQPSGCFFNHFGVILVSFLSAGCHWAAWGAPGGPPREPSWRDDEIIGLWLLLGVSSGTLLEPKSFSSRQYLIAKTTLKENLRQMLHERPSGTPSCDENNGFVYTELLFSNIHLHLQMTGNSVPQVPLWNPLGGLDSSNSTAGVPKSDFQRAEDTNHRKKFIRTPAVPMGE